MHDEVNIEDRIRSDVQSILIETGRMPRLVYLVNPLDADTMVPGDIAAPSVFQLLTSGGVVTVMTDKWRPRGGVTRAYKCTCGSLFVDDRSRSGKCSGCMMTTVARTVQEMTKPMHDDLYINTPSGKIKLTTSVTLGPGEFRIEQLAATTCARCSHTFMSRPDGFVDEALENEIAAHQERCFVAGDAVYVDTPSITGTGVVAGLVAPGLAAIKMDERGKHYEAGTRLAFGTSTLRRTPHPQQVEVVTRAGRLHAVYDLARRGEITTEQAKELLTMPDLEIKAPTIETPVLYDGLTAEECLARFLKSQREVLHRTYAKLWLTPDQLVAARDLWSAQLKAKLAASAEAGRLQVRIDSSDPDDFPW